MRTQDVIEQLGYSHKESKIYLAVLSLGESTVTEISQKTKIPRTSVQLIVERLEKEGLLNLFLKKNHRYWIAENPEKLLFRLREREVALRNILPELQGMRYEAGMRPVIKVFHGAEEIKRIMDDIIETKHHISSMLSWDDWIALFGGTYVEDFIKRRYQHFLKIRLLTTRTKTSEVLKGKDEAELRFTKFLNPETEIRNSNFIYGNKVAIISLSKREPVGVLIEDPDINHTMSVLFESMWQQGSDK